MLETLGCHAVTFQRTQGRDHPPPQLRENTFTLSPEAPEPQLGPSRLWVNDFIKSFLLKLLGADREEV